MKEEQRLFLVQAKSAYAVHRLLNANPSLHHCHALHYLQMATELLGKANAWRQGPVEKSHKAFVGFLRNLSTNPRAKKHLGYEGQNANWTHTLRKIIPIAERLQQMAPALAGDGPNPEYPWPADAPATAPAEFDFPIWKELATPLGRQLISLLDHLFSSAEDYL